MAATAPDDSIAEASYSARHALDEAQQYADLVADYAQMKYMFEGGEAEQSLLEQLVEDEDLRAWDEEYDPERVEGWITDPGEARETLERYEEAIEDYLDEEKTDLRSALQQAKVARHSADADGGLEASEHRHYGVNDIDPASVEHEIELADSLVATVDSYVLEVFNDAVRKQSSGPLANHYD
ncbi:MAG: hypothetical protein SVU32_00255 [Candidatus Nanohaloarchaea archaeon]|nr:hypothetical protein [Candidatus Nanohaloarchaea archaeon]